MAGRSYFFLRTQNGVNRILAFLGDGFGGLFRLDRSNKDLMQIVFDYPARKRFHQDGVLDGEVSGEPDVLEILLLYFFIFRQFRGSVNARIHQRAQNNQHAGKAQQSGHHAQIIFGPSEMVAARQFFAQDLFEPKEDEVNGKGDQNIGRNIGPEPTEGAAGIVENDIAEGSIKQSAQNDDAEPLWAKVPGSCRACAPGKFP